jgi:uroporphyrinogen-III synthase
MRRVLVTRPEPGASYTARRLKAAGLDPIVLPLTETRAHPVGPADLQPAFDAVAVTSANAIRHAPSELIAVLADQRCFAVGGKTAEAARAAGFSKVSEGPGDAVRLADQVISEVGQGTIAYLCGRVRLPDFEYRLSTGGVTVIALETYDTIETTAASGTPTHALGSKPIDAVLLFSTRAAHALILLRAAPQWSRALQSADFFCLSPRIAASLEGIRPEKIHVAAEPTEDELLSLVKGRW